MHRQPVKDLADGVNIPWLAALGRLRGRAKIGQQNFRRVQILAGKQNIRRLKISMRPPARFLQLIQPRDNRADNRIQRRRALLDFSVDQSLRGKREIIRSQPDAAVAHADLMHRRPMAGSAGDKLLLHPRPIHKDRRLPMRLGRIVHLRRKPLDDVNRPFLTVLRSGAPPSHSERSG